MQNAYDSLAPSDSQPGRAAAPSRGLFAVALRELTGFFEAFSQRNAAAQMHDVARRLQATHPEAAARMRRAAANCWD